MRWHLVDRSFVDRQLIDYYNSSTRLGWRQLVDDNSSTDNSLTQLIDSTHRLTWSQPSKAGWGGKWASQVVTKQQSWVIDQMSPTLSMSCLSTSCQSKSCLSTKLRSIRCHRTEVRCVFTDCKQVKVTDLVNWPTSIKSLVICKTVGQFDLFGMSVSLQSVISYVNP
jgi:hypothetical protein